MEQHKFTDEEIKNISHTLAIQKASTVSANLSKRKMREYIDGYLEFKTMLEKYNDTGELPPKD